MNNAKINLYRQGVRGGKGQFGEVGRIVGEIDNNVRIEIDAFIGHGDSYGRSPESRVCIESGNRCLFLGTINELVKKLA